MRFPVPASLLAAVLLLAVLPGHAAAANSVPQCLGTTTAVVPGGERAFDLRCVDRDGPETRRLEIVAEPQHGALEVLSGLTVRYAPAGGYTGNDSFTFKATDGAGESEVVTQQLRVTNANLAPVCMPQLFVVVNGSGELREPCVDPNEGDAAWPIVESGPEHGKVLAEWEGGSVRFQATGYEGPDSFELKATDGTLTGAVTEIDVAVVPQTAPECDAPVLPIPIRPYTDDTYEPKPFTPVCRDNNPDSSPISFGYGIAEQPEHGELEVVPYGRYQYTPDPGYEGPDSYRVFASRTILSEGGPVSLQGEPITVEVVVGEGANEPPRCVAMDPIRVRPGASVFAGAGCFDPDGDDFTRTFVPAPQHGGVAQDPSSPFMTPTYTADAGYTGADSFGTRASDGQSQSASVTQEIRVVGASDNTRPACRAGLKRVRNDRTANIGLQCFDLEHDDFDLEWNDPAHGDVVEGQNGFPFYDEYLIYTPDPGYVGPDKLTFTADDGHGDAVATTVLIEVFAPEPPECVPLAKRGVRTSGSLRVVISCYDDEGATSHTAHVNPAHGTITSNGFGTYIYEPTDGYTGDDSFTVSSTNSAGTTYVVQEIEVGDDVNTVPTCSPDYNAVTRQAPITLRISCWDEDQDGTTVAVVEGPAHGTLGSWDPVDRSFTYTPEAGFTGTDSFTFRGNDGRGDGPIATQSITVNAVDANSAPKCESFGLVGAKDQTQTFWPSCSDADNDPLTITIVEQPEHGTASGPDSSGRITYVPDPGFEGNDKIGIRANDGTASSPIVRIGAQVGTATPPRCTPLAANVDRDTPRRVRLSCQTGAGVPVAPQIATGPSHGTLSSVDNDGWVTYTPAAGFTGSDSFTFRGTDSEQRTGPPATVELNVVAPADDSTPPQTLDELPPPISPPDAGDPPAEDDPPARDPARDLAARRLGGTASPLDLDLGGARAFTGADGADGKLNVDSPSEKLLAVVCVTACDVSATQELDFGAARAAAKRRVKLKRQRITLQAGRAGVVTLRLTKAQRKRLKRARRATLTVTVSVRTAGRRAVRDRMRFRLRA